jgi:GTP-binding protein HflX
VGFISDLPHELVEAFRATLEEVREADVVLHVRDIASEESQAQAQDVREVLDRLGGGRRRTSASWRSGTRPTLLDARTREPSKATPPRAIRPAMVVSAVTGAGCDALLAAVAGLVDEAPPVGRLHARPGRARRSPGSTATAGSSSATTARTAASGLAVSLTPQALGQFEQLFPTARCAGARGRPPAPSAFTSSQSASISLRSDWSGVFPRARSFASTYLKRLTNLAFV